MKLNLSQLKRFPKNPSLYIWLPLLLLVAAGFIWPQTALAELSTLEGLVASLMGWIIYGLVWVVGQILVVVIWVLVEIAQYNNFINDGTVIKGWTIVRDLCNMFFILIMLLVAFGTILRIQGYGIKTLLKSVIIMAVLINFSKLICGLIIDFAQVIMLTFVNAFKDIGGANITSMLGIDSLLEIDPNATSEDITLWTIMGSYALALIYSLVALVAMIAITISLAMRMVMLWIYVILSPFAYLLAIVPATKSYSSIWWRDFSKNVIVGPVLAFFIWLSLATLGTYGDSGQIYEQVFDKTTQELNDGRPSSPLSGSGGPVIGATKIGTTDHMISFIISIGLLLGGLMISQQIGGAAGNAIGKASKKIYAGYRAAGKAGLGYAGKRLGQATGVPEFLKQRRERIETKWEDRAKSQAAKISGGVETFQKATVGKASKNISKAWNRLGGKEEADKLRKEARADKVEIKDLEARTSERYKGIKERNMRLSTPDITSALLNEADRKMAAGQTPDFETKKGKYSYYIGRGWENERGKLMTDEEMADVYREHAMETEIDTTVESLKTGVKDKETAAEALEKRQAKWNKAGKAALAIGGAGLGLATGGLGLAAVGALGGYSLKGLKATKDAGSMYGKMATSYHLNNINDIRKKISDNSDEALLNTIEDKSKKVADRMAAAWEAMGRGLLDRGGVEDVRKEMTQHYGGEDKSDMDIPWKNKVIGSKFEALASKTDGASHLYSAAYSGEPDKDTPAQADVRRKAKDRISALYSQGKTKMKDMDINTLSSSIEELSGALSNKNFKKEFDNLDTARQNVLIKSLSDNSKNQSYEVRSKLALVTDIDRGFRGSDKESEFKARYVKNLSIEDLSDVIAKGTDEQRDALSDFIAGDRSKVNSSVLKDDSSKAKSVRNYFDLNKVEETKVKVEGVAGEDIRKAKKAVEPEKAKASSKSTGAKAASKVEMAGTVDVNQQAEATVRAEAASGPAAADDARLREDAQRMAAMVMAIIRGQAKATSAPASGAAKPAEKINWEEVAKGMNNAGQPQTKERDGVDQANWERIIKNLANEHKNQSAPPSEEEIEREILERLRGPQGE